MEREPDFLGGVFKIALGIALGGLMLFVWFKAYERYEARQALRAMSEVFQQSSAEMRRERAEREAAQRLQRIRDREASEAKLLRQAVAQQQAAQRAREASESHRLREAAWARFYQPSAQCLKEASVSCGNAHMRARAEFDRRYSAGELR